MTEITYEPPREPSPIEELMAAIPPAITTWRRNLDQSNKHPDRCPEFVALEAAHKKLKESLDEYVHER